METESRLRKLRNQLKVRYKKFTIRRSFSTSPPAAGLSKTGPWEEASGGGKAAGGEVVGGGEVVRGGEVVGGGEAASGLAATGESTCFGRGL